MIVSGNWWDSTVDYRNFRVYGAGTSQEGVYVPCRSWLRFMVVRDELVFQEDITIDGFLYHDVMTNPILDEDFVSLVGQLKASLQEAGARPRLHDTIISFTASRRQIIQDALSGFDVIVSWELSKADDVVRAVWQSVHRRAHDIMSDMSRHPTDEIDGLELQMLANLKGIRFDP